MDGRIEHGFRRGFARSRSWSRRRGRARSSADRLVSEARRAAASAGDLARRARCASVWLARARRRRSGRGSSGRAASRARRPGRASTRRTRRASSATRAWAGSRGGCAPRATRRGSRPACRAPASRRGAAPRARAADERRRGARPADRGRRLAGRRLGALGAHDGGAARAWRRVELGLTLREPRAWPAAARSCPRRRRRFARASRRAPRAGRTSTSSARSATASSGGARTGSGSRATLRRGGGGVRRGLVVNVALSARVRRPSSSRSLEGGARLAREAAPAAARGGRLHLGLGRQDAGRLLRDEVRRRGLAALGGVQRATACGTGRARTRSPRASSAGRDPRRQRDARRRRSGRRRPTRSGSRRASARRAGRSR